MKATIKKIANRANELSGMMSHGDACYAACRELGVPETELAVTAGLVSTELTNREINIQTQSPTTEARPAHPWDDARRQHASGATPPRYNWPQGWKPGM